MPRNIRINTDYVDITVPVATKKELLEFCNKIRAAGGANILEALLPSKKRDDQNCLIANALNFSCAVDAWEDDPEKGFSTWAMILPHNMSSERGKKLAEAVDCQFVGGGGYIDRIILPDHIGNAAWAFDEGAAFQDYAE